MNIQEASKIVHLTDNGKSVFTEHYSENDFYMANGYLNALNGPEVKELLSVLKYYQDIDDGKISIGDLVVPYARQTLSRWEYMIKSKL